MIQDNKVILKIIGSVFVAFGGIKIILGLESTWWALRYLFNFPNSNTFSEIFYYGGLALLLTFIIPAFSIIGGIGLLKYKRWGWIISVIVSSVLFIISSFGTINFIIASYRFRNTPVPPISEGSVVRYYSMIPTYIQGAASLIIILLLLRNSIKKPFLGSIKA